MLIGDLLVAFDIDPVSVYHAAHRAAVGESFVNETIREGHLSASGERAVPDLLDPPVPRSLRDVGTPLDVRVRSFCGQTMVTEDVLRREGCATTSLWRYLPEQPFAAGGGAVVKGEQPQVVGDLDIDERFVRPALLRLIRPFAEARSGIPGTGTDVEVIENGQYRLVAAVDLLRQRFPNTFRCGNCGWFTNADLPLSAPNCQRCNRHTEQFAWVIVGTPAACFVRSRLLAALTTVKEGWHCETLTASPHSIGGGCAWCARPDRTRRWGRMSAGTATVKVPALCERIRRLLIGRCR